MGIHASFTQAASGLGGAAGLGSMGAGGMGTGAPDLDAMMNNPQARAAVNTAIEKVGVFGQILWLMMQAPSHKHLFISDLEWLVMPALQLNQFRLWQNQGMPVAYASWAYLDEGAAARLKENIKKLAPADWNAGQTLWLIDMVAPFGGLDEALKELKEQIFPGETIKSLQPGPGGGVAVVEW